MSLTNEVQYPEPASSGYLFANKASDGTITYVWQNGSSDQPEAPSISVASGTYTQGQTVTITSATTDATIYYTTDGSAPTTAATPYTGPIRIKDSCTLSAVAVSNGFSYSTVTFATYVIIRRIVTTTQTNSYELAVLTSDDSGSTWSGQTVPIINNPATRVASLNGVTVISGPGAWAISTDHGSTFEGVSTVFNGAYWPSTNNSVDICVINNMFIGFFGYNQNNNNTYTAYIGVSSTGVYFKYVPITLEQQPQYWNPFGANTSSMAYYNGIYLVWLNSCILKSTDNCASFTAITSMPFSGSRMDMRSTTHGFVAANSSTLYTSTDGETWAESTAIFSNLTSLIGIINDTVIAYSSIGANLISYDGGTTFIPNQGLLNGLVNDYAQSDTVYAETGNNVGNVLMQQRQIQYKEREIPVVYSQNNTGYRITWNGDKFIAIDNSWYINRIGKATDTSETLSTLITYITENNLTFSGFGVFTLAAIADTESDIIPDTQQITPAPTVTKSDPYVRVCLSDTGNDVFTTSYTAATCGCYNPNTGLLYIVNPSTLNIQTINLTTGACVDLTTSAKGYVKLIYCSSDGFLYGCVNGNYIYKINATTGEETAVTTIGRYWISITYNPTNNTIYGICTESYVQVLYSISTTGVETLLTTNYYYAQVSYDNNGSILIEGYDGSIIRWSTTNVATTVGTCEDQGMHYPVTNAVTFNSIYLGIYQPSGTLVGISSDGTSVYTPTVAAITTYYKLLIVAGSQLYAIVDEYSNGLLVNQNRLRLINLGTANYDCVDATITGDPQLLPIIFGTTDGSDPTPVNTGMPGLPVIQNSTGTLINITQSYGVYGYASSAVIPKLVVGSTLKIFTLIPNYAISEIVTITI